MFSIATDSEDSDNKSLSRPIKTRKKGKHVKKEVSDPSLLKCKRRNVNNFKINERTLINEMVKNLSRKIWNRIIV